MYSCVDFTERYLRNVLLIADRHMQIQLYTMKSLAVHLVLLEYANWKFSNKTDAHTNFGHTSFLFSANIYVVPSVADVSVTIRGITWFALGVKNEVFCIAQKTIAHERV